MDNADKRGIPRTRSAHSRVPRSSKNEFASRHSRRVGSEDLVSSFSNWRLPQAGDIEPGAFASTSRRGREPEWWRNSNINRDFNHGGFSNSGPSRYRSSNLQTGFEKLPLQGSRIDSVNINSATAPSRRLNSDSYRNRERHELKFTQNQNTQRNSRPRMGFRLLEDLLLKDSENLVMELMNSKRGFLEFIQKDLSPDAIVLFTKVLAKVAVSEFIEVKYKVLQQYLEDEFSEKLIDYILRLPLQNSEDKRKNRYFWNDTDEFWNNIIAISKDVLRTLPTFAVKVLPKILKSLLGCFNNFEEFHQQHISDEIIDNVEKLNNAVRNLVAEEEEKQKLLAQKKLRFEDDEGEPPDDFRNMSVYPNFIELTTKTTFVRKNVVRGPYRDVEHYLDIQFRLLREDFVGPLRSAIMDFLSAEKKRIENIKIHRRVEFLHSETVNESYCVRLRFDFQDKKKKFSNENSKRFLFGALLVFTCDNFKSFIFGKVVDRKGELLEKGELIVGFDEQVNIKYNTNYIMVEYNVYFEPYFHVLNCLKTMHADNFPMIKYIINVNDSVSPPEYITPNTTYRIENCSLNPLQNWPNLVFYGFNQAQNEAFKAALTQEFVIIQGPPGTGKTYLGLKIAKTLLRNKQCWFRQSPMLLICYTNHALDQFLEGVTEFTENILRIGGQSKSKKLDQYNLRNQRKHRLSASTLQQRDQVKRLLNEMGEITETFKKLDLYNSVISFDVFRDVVPNYHNTWFEKATPEQILNWLLGGNETVSSTANRNRNTGQSVNKIEDNHLKNVGNEENTADNDDEGDNDDNDRDSNNEDMFDDLFDELNSLDIRYYSPLTTLDFFLSNIKRCENLLDLLGSIKEPTFENLLDADWYDLELGTLKRNFFYLSMRIRDGRQQQIQEEPRNRDLKNPHNMSADDRWALYYYWLHLYKEKLTKQKKKLDLEFKTVYKIYEEMRSIEDTNMMKEVLVIGITTTGAARLRSSLRTLKSPVVIVEEAAEVLEAHIVTSLTEHCKHLILIGDHQQLKPSTASYKIETYYHLGISLFERMVLNNIHLYSLQIQHRMKPEIARLICPHIYPDLKNHNSVLFRPKIAGVDKCVYFINHKISELNTEGTSKKNPHEAKFLIYFAIHLIHNGYEPEDITILAAYLGQMFEMQRERKKHLILQGVRISVLDNYQGEESNIILLSLVRNNEENKIGFLSIENRVCVALSRARNGFYIMGNMDQLCQNELWRKIRQTLEDQNAIGEELPLRCEIHHDTVTLVKSGEDFLNISEGGCNKICDEVLVCGHKCKSLCHIQNRDHTIKRCNEVCGKLLCDSNPAHICEKMCSEPCGPCIYLVSRNLSCGHNVKIQCHIDTDTYDCPVEVLTTLPCSHEANKPCYADLETFRCPHPCETRVEPCGHACKKKCHVRFDPDHLKYKCTEKCTRFNKGCTVKGEQHICRKLCYEDCEDCFIQVKKSRTVCPHYYDVCCSANVDELECLKPCTKVLSCGHKCTNKCNEDCCILCQKKVVKTIPLCGHALKLKCYEEPNRKNCNQKCPLDLPCGHPCTTKCNEPCTKNCKKMVDCNVKGVCGHMITKMPCYLFSNQDDDTSITKYCTVLCGAALKCKHVCSGTCGECSQGRIHKRCNEKCDIPLVCDHLCKFPCRESCRPCNEKCTLKCVHSKCNKKCGDVCTPCSQPCLRQCQHQKCSKQCASICNVPPCEQPCQKLLKCRHPCIGFCGEPCPPKCLVCDKEELTTIEFGYEAEDARYVLLNDCNHVIENTALEQWLKSDDGHVSFKKCPRCKTAIKTTTRFSDYTKKSMNDVSKAKLILHGTQSENDAKRRELRLSISELLKSSLLLRSHCELFGKGLSAIELRLRSTKNEKLQRINKHELNALESKLQILQHIFDLFNSCSDDTQYGASANRTLEIPRQINFIVKVLFRDEDYITDQEIYDVDLELNRLSRMVIFDQIRGSHQYRYNVSNPNVLKKVTEIKALLFSFDKFVDDIDSQVTAKLTELNKIVVSGIGISKEEKRMIHRAMGFSKGHWFKCRNGHIYAITECGGAMEVSVCPDCKEKIGGTNHRLLENNQVATEMDGATYGAWSEQANMANYQFD